MINNDLHWLAFRYVAGDMTAAEEAHFEQRLADEQDLREAVEQAVELTEAIRLVHAEPVPISSRRRFLRRPAIWAAGLAASLFVAFGLIWSIYTASEGPAVPGNGNEFSDANSPTAPEVARAWVELRDRGNEGTLEPGPTQPESLDESELGMDDVVETDVNVPPWMLAAFSKQDKRNR